MENKQQSELIPLKTQYNASIFVDAYFKFVFRSYNKHLKNVLKKYSLLWTAYFSVFVNNKNTSTD